MKKIIVLVLLIGALVALFFFKDESGKVRNENTPEQGASFNPDPSNASFDFNNETIVLSQGKRVTSTGEETMLLDQTGRGDLNGDGKEDTAVFLARIGGGSGVFIHVAAYVSGPVNYKGTNTIFIGDRVAPQSISIENGVLTATFLDRAEDEPYAAEPTVSVTKEFIYQNGTLEERE